MDFDEFEKQQEAKTRPATIGTTAGFYGRHSTDHATEPRQFHGTGSGGILDQFEEWEDYMQFGGAGRNRVGGFRVDI